MGAVCSKGDSRAGRPNSPSEDSDHTCLRLCRCFIPRRRRRPTGVVLDMHPTPAHQPRRRVAHPPDRSRGPSVVPARYAFPRGAREQDDDGSQDFVFHIPSRPLFPENRSTDIDLRPLGPPPAYSPPFDYGDYDDHTSDETCSDLDFGESCFFSPIHLPELVSDQPRVDSRDASPPLSSRLRLPRDEDYQACDYQCVLPGASTAVCQSMPDPAQGAVAYHCCRDAVSRAGRCRPVSPQPQEDSTAPPCPRCGVCHFSVSPQFLCGSYCQCRRQDQECCMLCMPMVCPDQPALRSARALRGGEFREPQAFSVQGPDVAEGTRPAVRPEPPTILIVPPSPEDFPGGLAGAVRVHPLAPGAGGLQLDPSVGHGDGDELLELDILPVAARGHPQGPPVVESRGFSSQGSSNFRPVQPHSQRGDHTGRRPSWIVVHERSPGRVSRPDILQDSLYQSDSYQ